MGRISESAVTDLFAVARFAKFDVMDYQEDARHVSRIVPSAKPQIASLRKPYRGVTWKHWRQSAFNLSRRTRKWRLHWGG